jgi:mono/diheme cytochrome c family protein
MTEANIWRCTQTSRICHRDVGDLLAFSPRRFAQKKNPIEASQESISKGQTIFKKNCQMCHGEKGMGMGPQASV